MATEILRPNGATGHTSIPAQYPSSTYHWDKVDEATPDDDTTYVINDAPYAPWLFDLYELENHSTGSGIINSIKIYFRCRRTNQYYSGWAKPSQLSDSTITHGTAINLTIDWVTYSQVYTINPATSAAYTWAEIDALRVGVNLRSYWEEPEWAIPVWCTQVYVEVDYTVIVAPTVTTQDATGVGFD